MQVDTPPVLLPPRGRGVHYRQPLEDTSRVNLARVGGFREERGRGCARGWGLGGLLRRQTGVHVAGGQRGVETRD